MQVADCRLPGEDPQMRQPRVALVTWANRGIGFEVCRQLASKGLRTILTGRDQGKTASAAERLQAEGLSVAPLPLDVTDAESVKAAVRDVKQRFGGVDVLVNNAAILLDEDADALTMSLDDLRATLETNVVGAAAMCQAFVPGMVERRYGRVVNVSSGAGQIAHMATYAPAYSISKAALNALTRQLAAAVGRTGVLVNAVNPGWVRTSMGGSGAPRSVEEGADSIVWLATLPARGPTGGFFSDRQRIEW
jgi:NAD(P)-dependent dehydrogenase (short-subunit alcohol dehydrogenase family)